MPEIAVIIPSYNGTDYLKNCLESILEKVRQINFLIVIVDDASTDDRVKELLTLLQKEKYIQVIQNDTNLGFSKSVNKGISFAISQYNAAKYLIILNQDVSLVNDIIEKAIHCMEETNQAGIYGPRLFNSDGSIQNSFYAFPTVGKKLAQLLGLTKLGKFLIKSKPSRFKSTFFPAFAKTYLKNHEALLKPIEVPWLCGACLIIPKELFADIEGFDENFRMYGEDMDFCLRVREKGWKIYCIPDCHLIHYGNKKLTRNSPAMLNSYYDSMEYYFKKHYVGLEQKILVLCNRIERWKKKH
jgi:GT2 family glycosyltransferase